MSKDNKNFKFDIISSISEDIIDLCTAQRAKLRSKLVVKTKKKRTLKVMALAAALTLLICASFLISIFGNWNAPIYRGMSVSGNAPVIDTKVSHLDVLSRDFDLLDMIAHTSGIDVLDNKDKDKDKDKNNTTTTTESYHNFDPSSGKELYYANKNEDFYITVHIENPEKFEIVSFTLNGEKYSSYMFEQGSDMENLVFKCNAGDATGIVEYTIDAIKYIDGTVIKDVVIGGDQTVKVGINDSYKPSATASIDVSYTDATAKIALNDSKGVVSERGGKLFAALYQGNKKVYSTDELSLEGENEVKFEKLEDGTEYEIKVIALYDSYDGQGVAEHVIRTAKFTTKKLVEISASHPEQAKDFIKVNIDAKDPEGCITKSLVELIDKSNGSVVKTLDHLGECTFDSLEVLKSFEIKISCTYAMPDGNGERTATHSLDAVTQSAGLEIWYPETPDQKPMVRGIGNCKDTELYINMDVYPEAFKGNPFIVSVILGENAEWVNSRAFYDCPALKSAFFKCTSENLRSMLPSITHESFDSSCKLFFAMSSPAGSVGDGCFFNCKEVITDSNGFTIAVLKNGSLTLAAYEGNEINVTLPEGITAIGNSAFAYSSSLRSIIIPEGVKTIDSYAFVGCSKLQSVILPNSLTTIKDHSFYECVNLVSITLPDSLTSIGSYAFYECDSFKNITLPDSLKSINDYVFYGCNNLESIILPDSLISIGDYAFYDCYNLEDASLPDSLTTIGESAFRNCTNIKSLSLPDSLTIIGKNAFRRCGIKYIFIPEGVRTVGKDAFAGGTANIITSAKQLPSSWDNNFADPEMVIWNCDKIITDAQGFTYALKNDGGIVILSYEGNASKIILPENTVEIAPYAFYECQSLKELTIPEGVTSIGDNAFENCYELHSINLPDSLVNIGKNAFKKCGIKYIFIPKSVSTIGSNAFSYTSTIIVASAAQMPSSWDNSFQDLGNMIIWNCDKIITNAQGFTYALKNDGSAVIISYEGTASKVTFPKNTAEILSHAFYSCNELTELIIPEGVTRIGDNAFAYCYNLESISLPDTLEYIGEGAFYECICVKEIILPDSLTYVGNAAFQTCKGAQRIYIPNSVEFMGSEAFVGCSTAVFQVEFPSRPEGWDVNWIEDYALKDQVVWGYKD